MKCIKVLVLTLIVVAFFVGACAPKQNGLLKGRVSIGPLTPVERIGVPTPIPPAEVFTSRGINIFNENGVKIKSLYFDPDGTYSVGLVEGTYQVKLIPTGIDHASELPVTVTIHANQTTTLDITIDTGIR